MKDLQTENDLFIEKFGSASEHSYDEGFHTEKSDKRSYISLFIIVVLLIVSNCYFVAKWRLVVVAPCIRPQLTFSPSKMITSYEKKTLWRDIGHNVFTGLPRPEFDQAWHQLLSPMVIRITNEELKAINKPSIAFIDGSGFIAETAAYHELHCIKRLRRHLYADHYYPNMTADEEYRENRHVDHCLEYLREAAMCRGDPTIVPFHWEEGKPFSSQESDHECINWNAYASWAESRKVDASDYSRLTRDVVHPV